MLFQILQKKVRHNTFVFFDLLPYVTSGTYVKWWYCYKFLRPPYCFYRLYEIKIEVGVASNDVNIYEILFKPVQQFWILNMRRGTARFTYIQRTHNSS